MSDLDRVKKLAGLKETGGYVDYDRFKDRGKGKITGYRSPAQKRVDDLNLPDNWLQGGNVVRKEQPGPYRTFPLPSEPEMNPSLGGGKPWMGAEEYAREMLKGMKGAPKPGTAEYEKLVQKITNPSLGGGFDPETGGFAKPDPRINIDLLRQDRPMKSEAVGDSAECFYDLQDEYCGEQCPSMPHKILIDELVRYLSGDQLQDFCDDFRRHHMDGMEESVEEEAVTEAPYQYDMTDKGDMHDALGDVQNSMDDAVKNIQKAAGLASQVHDAIEDTLYTDESVESVEESNDLKELKTLAGIKTEDNPSLGRFPGGLQDTDAIIKRGKENQLIGKYRPPGSPRDPELDDILSRRAKELEDNPSLGRFPGGDPEIINKKGLGPIKPEKKPFPGFEPGMAINLDAFKDRYKRGIVDPEKDIKDRIDRFKGRDDLRQFQFGKKK